MNGQGRRARGIILLTAIGLLWSAGHAATVPGGFVDSTYVDLPSDVTAMEFAPDGRLFICQQSGKLLVVQNGVLLTKPFLTLPVVATGERGLLGVAFDPNFATNHFVYVYYTTSGPYMQLSRFTRDANDPLLVPLEMRVAGVKHVSGDIRAHLADGMELQFIREPNNKADRSATIIATTPEGRRAGYVPRQYSSLVANLIDRNVELVGIALREIVLPEDAGRWVVRVARA